MCYFFSFKYLCKLIYIYCYTDTINFIIFSQLLTYQFLTSRNKIIKYECDQPQLKINVLRKCYNTYCYHNIFTIVEISVSYRSNKKCQVHNILTLISIMPKVFFFYWGAPFLFFFSFFLFKYASWFELCFCFCFLFFVFFFLRSLYVYFVLTMQVYIVNTQKWLILYTFAQKIVNIVTHVSIPYRLK